MNVTEIEKAIVWAENQKAFPEPYESIYAMSKSKSRFLTARLINNRNYLEVGTARGGIFVPVVSIGKPKYAIGVDNFCEYQRHGNNYEAFKQNAGLIPKKQKWEFINKDFLQAEITKKIDVYLYDGAHDYENTYKALGRFIDNMNERFIMMYDDCNWTKVVDGADASIKDLGVKIIYRKILKGKMDRQWYNGWGIYLLEK